MNIFVPSGGGQWAIQAPIVIPAAQSLGVPLHQAAMAVAFGDAWTNMIQPLMGSSIARYRRTQNQGHNGLLHSDA